MKDISCPFKFAESCMFRYLENLAKIEELRNDLRFADTQSSVKVQNYEGYSVTNGYIDNVPKRILTIDAIEILIANFERRTKPITRLLNDLDNPYSSPKRRDLLNILRFRYIHNNTQDITMSHLKMSKYRYSTRRNQLVEMVMEYMTL